MTEVNVSRALAASMDSVLEQMFFVTELEETQTSPSSPAIRSRVRFGGDPSGWIEVEVEAPAAAAMASDFLALDAAELTTAQIEDVVLELSNMLCGAALSRLEEGSLMRLSAPSLVPVTEPDCAPASAARSVHIGAGVVTARFHFETPCPA